MLHSSARQHFVVGGAASSQLQGNQMRVVGRPPHEVGAGFDYGAEDDDDDDDEDEDDDDSDDYDPESQDQIQMAANATR